ncbi:MAG: triose-phosphate isomerase, partial [Candidatus Omnitrophota bacterium]
AEDAEIPGSRIDKLLFDIFTGRDINGREAFLADGGQQNRAFDIPIVANSLLLFETARARTGLLAESKIEHMARAYEYLNEMLAGQRDIQDSDILELAFTCTSGPNPRPWREHRLYFENERARFNSLKRPVIEWYRRHKYLSPYRQAAGVFVRIVSHPQLFGVDGNRGTGILLMNFILVKNGKFPWISTPENAKAFEGVLGKIHSLNRDDPLSNVAMWSHELELAHLLERYGDKKYLRDGGVILVIGAQDVSVKRGTGQILVQKLVGRKVDFCFAGHPDLAEGAQLANEKVKAVLAAGLFPIVFVYDTLAERKQKRTDTVLKSQLEIILRGITAEQAEQVFIVYLPLWVKELEKNRQKAMNAGEVQKIFYSLRNWLAEKYDLETAEKIYLIYGRRVNDRNVGRYMSLTGIDGVFVFTSALPAKRAARITLGAGKFNSSKTPIVIFNLKDSGYEENACIMDYARVLVKETRDAFETIVVVCPDFLDIPDFSYTIEMLREKKQGASGDEEESQCRISNGRDGGHDLSADLQEMLLNFDRAEAVMITEEAIVNSPGRSREFDRISYSYISSPSENTRRSVEYFFMRIPQNERRMTAIKAWLKIAVVLNPKEAKLYYMDIITGEIRKERISDRVAEDIERGKCTSSNQRFAEEIMPLEALLVTMLRFDGIRKTVKKPSGEKTGRTGPGRSDGGDVPYSIININYLDFIAHGGVRAGPGVINNPLDPLSDGGEEFNERRWFLPNKNIYDLKSFIFVMLLCAVIILPVYSLVAGTTAMDAGMTEKERFFLPFANLMLAGVISIAPPFWYFLWLNQKRGLPRKKAQAVLNGIEKNKAFRISPQGYSFLLTPLPRNDWPADKDIFLTQENDKKYDRLCRTDSRSYRYADDNVYYLVERLREVEGLYKEGTGLELKEVLNGAVVLNVGP